MKKLFSILLLVAFALPLATPLLAAMQDDDAHLPPCCRRHGKHRCSMGMMGKPGMIDKAVSAAMAEMVAEDAPGQDAEPHHLHVATPVEKCPFCPASIDAPAQPIASLPFFASLPPVRASRDHIYAQPLSQQLVLHTLSDSERGPPALLFS
ncbi:hypothetical protein [Terriglobus albidus]|uniref:hypothetical protein n=1 Tax=Terriglobus albidus TaxID=1592106 RepID=UPI0021E043B1|nr:hypothetical protein [Terriglobus albidus]